MTRKDYVAIAEAIREARKLAEGDADQRAIDLVAKELIPVFKRDNPAFQPDKFLEAAEYQALEA